MIKSNKLILCILAFFILAGIACTEALAKKKGRVDVELKEDQALVYVIRKSRFVGSAVKYFTYADDRLLGVMANGRYTYAYLDPGSYLFWANLTEIRREVDLLPGRAYYIEIWDDFDFIEEEEAFRLMGKLKFTTPKAKELRTAERHIRKRYKKALKKESKLHKASVESIAAMKRPEAEGQYLKIPAYSELNLVLKENVTSNRNATGDHIWFETASDFLVDDEIAVKKGTPVSAIIRHGAKGDSGGEAGTLDIIVPFLTGADGNLIPLMGRIESAGRGKEGQAVAEAIATGFVTGFFTYLSGGVTIAVSTSMTRGAEAYLLVGDEFSVWTRDDHWVSKYDAGTNSDKLLSEDDFEAPIVLKSNATERIVFKPEKRKKPALVQVQIQSATGIDDAYISKIGMWELPEYIEPLETRAEKGGTLLEFSGWDIIRFAQLTSETTVVPITLEGELSNGELFESEASIEIVLKAK